MKLWRGGLLVIFLVAVPILSACESLGMGSSQQEQERAYYEEQLKAYQKQQEYYRQQQEVYNQQVAEGLKQWSEAYRVWLEKQQEQQLGQFEGIQTTNQTDNQS